MIAVTSMTRRYRLVAVFERSAYLLLEENLFCVATEGFPRGPLTICLARSDWLRFRALCCSTGAVQQCIELHFDCGLAKPWCPSPLPCTANLDNMISSIKSVARLAPEQSLLAVAAWQADTPFSPSRVAAGGHCANATPITTDVDRLNGHLQIFFHRALSRLVAMCHRPERHSAGEQLACLIPLLGAGRGLTPAGDDCVAGLLIGLRISGWQETIDRWLPQLLPEIASRTHHISATLLVEACFGRVDEAMENLLEYLSVNQPDAITSVARHLDAIGHSSGWDFAAGLYIGLQAATETGGIPAASPITQTSNQYA